MNPGLWRTQAFAAGYGATELSPTQGTRRRPGPAQQSRAATAGGYRGAGVGADGCAREAERGRGREGLIGCGRKRGPKQDVILHLGEDLKKCLPLKLQKGSREHMAPALSMPVTVTNNSQCLQSCQASRLTKLRNWRRTILLVRRHN